MDLKSCRVISFDKSNLRWLSGFELVKQNQFAKISEVSEKKDQPQAKFFFGFANQIYHELAIY